MDEKLVKRCQKVAFYGVAGQEGAVAYHRMTGFTELSKSANPKQYTRQYVDFVRYVCWVLHILMRYSERGLPS